MSVIGRKAANRTLGELEVEPTEGRGRRGQELRAEIRPYQIMTLRLLPDNKLYEE